MATDLHQQLPFFPRQLCWFLACTLLLILMLLQSAHAEIYKYRDDDGRLIFVDDKDKIPFRYQEQTSTLSETGGNLGSYESPQKLQPEEVSTIDVAPAPPSRAMTNEYQTPVTIQGNRILVPAEIGMGNRSAKLMLLLDTGATATVFHREALSGLELPKGKTYKARIAGGGTVKSRRMPFRYLSVGPFRIQDKLAMVINLQGKEVPFDGMLGMDFLKDHPYQVDYDNQVITWQEPK